MSITFEGEQAHLQQLIDLAKKLPNVKLKGHPTGVISLSADASGAEQTMSDERRAELLGTIGLSPLAK